MGQPLNFYHVTYAETEKRSAIFLEGYWDELGNLAASTPGSLPATAKGMEESLYLLPLTGTMES